MPGLTRIAPTGTETVTLTTPFNVECNPTLLLCLQIHPSVGILEVFHHLLLPFDPPLPHLTSV